MPRDGVSVRVADIDRTGHVRRGRATWSAFRRGPGCSRERTRSTADEEAACRARERHTRGALLRAVPSRGVAAGLRPEPSGVARLALPPTVLDAGRRSKELEPWLLEHERRTNPVLRRLELRLSLAERCRKRPGFSRGSVFGASRSSLIEQNGEGRSTLALPSPSKEPTNSAGRACGRTRAARRRSCRSRSRASRTLRGLPARRREGASPASTSRP